MSKQELTIRKATAEDSRQVASLFQTTYGRSSHPCKDEQYVRDGICSGRTIWRVAVDEKRLVACVTLILNSWNRSWELARAITLPEYRGAGLGTELMQRSLDDACVSSACDVIVGFPRSRTMLNIVSGCLKPALLPVGHDGGINIAHGMREYHAVTLGLNPTVRFRHCIPETRSLADTEFVQQNIFGPLGLSPQRGQYPPHWVVGDGIENADLRPFSFVYDPLCPSNAVEITGYNADSADAGRVAGELITMLDSFCYARHTRLVVPADKCEFIERLAGAGFEVTAYLPAWYVYRKSRYDCVLMVRGRFCKEPTDHGIGDLVDRFRYCLSQ